LVLAGEDQPGQIQRIIQPDIGRIPVATHPSGGRIGTVPADRQAVQGRGSINMEDFASNSVYLSCTFVCTLLAAPVCMNSSPLPK